MRKINIYPETQLVWLFTNNSFTCLNKNCTPSYHAKRKVVLVTYLQLNTTSSDMRFNSRFPRSAFVMRQVCGSSRELISVQGIELCDLDAIWSGTTLSGLNQLIAVPPTVKP